MSEYEGMGIRVVVADDDPVIRALVQAALLTCGCELSVVENGASALAEIRAVRPHLALLDVRMPLLDGLEVCRLVRADTTLASTRLVMLTATADERSAREAGADAYLPKPFRPSELRDVLRSLVSDAA